MLAEFDDNKDTVRSRKTKKAVKIISKYAQEYIVAKTPQERDNLWKIRHSAAALMWHLSLIHISEPTRPY